MKQAIFLPFMKKPVNLLLRVRFIDLLRKCPFMACRVSVLVVLK